MRKIKIIQGDCMEVMAQYPDKYFDLAVVDPPYGIGEDSRKTKGRVLKKDGTFIYKTDKRNGRQIVIAPKKYSGGLYDNQIMGPSYFEELIRVSKNQIVWGENNYPHHLGRGRIFWNKCVSGDFSDGEIAFCSYHESIRIVTYMWSGYKQGESIENGSKMQGNNKLWENRIHPNQKPIKLYDWIYQKYLPEGGKVLDTHGGSMSNVISWIKAGNIDGVCTEIDADYFKDAKKRIQAHLAQQDMFREPIDIKYVQPELIISK